MVAGRVPLLAASARRARISTGLWLTARQRSGSRSRKTALTSGCQTQYKFLASSCSRFAIFISHSQNGGFGNFGGLLGFFGIDKFQGRRRQRLSGAQFLVYRQRLL